VASVIYWPLLAAFISGFAWSGLDIARKSLARDFRPVVIATGLSLGLAMLFGGWTALSLPAFQPLAYVRPAAVSIALNLAIQLSILESVRRGELSQTIPLLSMTPVATALFGLAVLGERPSPRQWAGIALVFVGAVGLAVSRSVAERNRSRSTRFHFDRGGLIMLVAAVCISAAAPFDKLAVGASSPALHGFVLSLVSGGLLLAYLGWRRELGRIGSAFRQRPVMTLAACLAFAALGLQFAAYQGVMVGVVETIKRVVGLVMSLVAGHLVFGESMTTRKLATVALMAIGVALLLS
jgi:drug/metabolite transporter (DMT)-like permease